jgi:hypothetical protein
MGATAKDEAPAPTKANRDLQAKGEGPTMTTTSVQEATRTGTRPVRCCEGCGERAGSISAGTGRPLVLDKASGRFFHLSCKPGAVRSGEFLERMGAGL